MQQNKLTPVEKVVGAPMPLVQERKLLIFAISSIHKDVDAKALTDNKKISLSVGVCYSPAEALRSAYEGLKAQGLKPDDFLLDVQSVFIAAERVIDIPGTHALAESLDLPVQEVEIAKEKSALAAYVRYVFDLSGTAEEIKMAEKVIKRFEAGKHKK